MSRLRLQSWATNRRGTYCTVNLDGVPLGCDGLFKDPALVTTIGADVAKLPHKLRDDGAMMFTDAQRYVARHRAGVALKEYVAHQDRLNKGVHFDREEAAALLALADYMGSGFVGEHTKTIAMIRQKVGR